MILSDLRILSRANEQSQYSGLDCLEHCLDKTHFNSYPYKINYHYNSRGFRDQEWPTDLTDLKSSIWCIGDSFTSGLGSPIEHIWPAILSQKTNIRTINISLDGASNNWIARQACTILENIDPVLVVIQWSYSHRRELALDTLVDAIWQEFYSNIRDPGWPDCNSYRNLYLLPETIQTEINQHSWLHGYDLDTMRKISHSKTTIEEDVLNTQNCIDQVCKYSTKNVIHSFIPNWHCAPTELNFHSARLIKFNQIDFARDGHHYDIKTADYFVDQVLETLNLPTSTVLV